MQWRAPSYVARNELETLMASEKARDWIRLSEMLLGPAPTAVMLQPNETGKGRHIQGESMGETDCYGYLGKFDRLVACITQAEE